MVPVTSHWAGHQLAHVSYTGPTHPRGSEHGLAARRQRAICGAGHHHRLHPHGYGNAVHATHAHAAPDAAAAVQQPQPRQTGAAAQPSDQHGGVLALKEWAVTCAALAHGQQTVVLRKGGIRAPAFVPLARRFLLFPTSFHSGADLMKPRAAKQFAQVEVRLVKELRVEPKDQELLTVEVAAEVTGAWTTADPAVLAALDSFHVWTPEYLEKRLRWRQKQPITVLELRCQRLQAPLTLPNSPDLWGCFSWVTLPVEQHAQDEGGGSSSNNNNNNNNNSSNIDSSGTPGIDMLLRGAVPVVADEDFSRQAQNLRVALQGLHGIQELQMPPC